MITPQITTQAIFNNRKDMVSAITIIQNPLPKSELVFLLTAFRQVVNNNIPLRGGINFIH